MFIIIDLLEVFSKPLDESERASLLQLFPFLTLKFCHNFLMISGDVSIFLVASDHECGSSPQISLPHLFSAHKLLLHLIFKQ